MVFPPSSSIERVILLHQVMVSWFHVGGQNFSEPEFESLSTYSEIKLAVQYLVFVICTGSP